MPLEERRCELIIARMKNMDIQTRLDAINEAKKIYPQLFQPDMDDAGYARSAMITVQLYNIIRDELQVKIVSIKQDLAGESGSVSNGKTLKPPTVKKKAPEKPKMDMASMMAAFQEMKNKGELG